MKKILLPIKPIYVNRIFNGTKKVEYRKQVAHRKDISNVLIYATRPVCKVVGEFKIAGILSASPQELWNDTSHIGGINEADYFKYFAGHSKAYAYQIKDVMVFNKPRDLSEYGVKRAPQSFIYVEDNIGV